MPVDASIPLQVQPFQPPNPMSALNQVGALQQIQQNQRAMAGQNALRQIFADQSNLDPDTGNPTPEAMAKVFAADPGTGMQLRNAMATQQLNKVKLQGAQADVVGKINDMIQTEVREPALNAYDETMKQTGSPEAAQQAAQEAYSKGFQTVSNSGLLSREQIGQMPTAFDYKRTAARSMSYKDRKALEQKERSEKRQESAQAERERHDRATEERMASTAASAAAARTDKSESAWQVVQGETKDGKPIQYRYNARTAEATKLNGEPFAEGEAPVGASKAGVAKPKGELIDDDTASKMARQYLTGDTSVMANIGRGAQAADNIAKVRRKIYEEADKQNMSPEQIAAKVAEFQGIKAGERTAGTRTAQIGMAANEAKMLMPLALEASDKVDRTQFPTLNSVLLAAERGTGDENVVRLGIATNSLINVYARAISPTGVPTVSDKDHARELLGAAWSKGQYRVGVDQLRKEIEAAGKSPGMVRQEFREAITKNSPVSDSVPAVGAQGGPPVMTEKEYDAAPSGTQYRTKAGGPVMTKP